MNLPYAESLAILQKTGRTVELVLSQVYSVKQKTAVRRKSLLTLSTQNVHSLLDDVPQKESDHSESRAKNSYDPSSSNLLSTPSKSMPNLPKVRRRSSSMSHSFALLFVFQVVAIMPKSSKSTALPRGLGQSRRYIGPVRYPVTPGKSEKDPIKSALGPSKHQLSLLADSDDEQVFI